MSKKSKKQKNLNPYTFTSRIRLQILLYVAGIWLVLLVVTLLGAGNVHSVKAFMSELFTLVWSSAEIEVSNSIAWGDVDGDGDLDLAVGNANHPNHLYQNNNGTLSNSAVWSSVENDDANSIAWGDIDNDGDLDLVVGSIEHTRLYRNDNGLLTISAVWTSGDAGSTSIALGDYDLDGDLDLAVGKYGSPNGVYRNDSGIFTSTPVWNSIEMDNTVSVAWGDYDGDGDLDLAVGNTGYPNGQPNRLYRNDAGVLTSNAVWSTAENDTTNSVAWGDYDNDGDLDLVVGNGGFSPSGGQPNRLYRNNAGILTTTAIWSSSESDNTFSITWGDYNNDGYLDLAAGNTFQPSRLYRNDDGNLIPDAVWSTGEVDTTLSVAWGDVDNDGDLDLAVGNSQQNRLYRNNLIRYQLFLPLTQR